MKILRVTKNKLSDSDRVWWGDRGIMYIDMAPALFSPMTSLSIRRAIDRQDIDIIEVYRQEDAIAALSARGISSKAGVKVIYSVEPNTPLPHHLHKEVIAGVDGWRFASSRQVKEKEGFKNCEIIAPLPLLPITITENESKGYFTASWIGDINDGSRLKEIIEIIDSADADIRLRICGGGQAREVMPVVRLSRRIVHPERVTWVGESYDVAKEASLCNVIIRSDSDITLTETAIKMAGKPVIDISELRDYIDKPWTSEQGTEMTTTKYAESLRNYYLKISQS